MKIKQWVFNHEGCMYVNAGRVYFFKPHEAS